MQKAADQFGEFLSSVNFADPKIPLFSNVTGKRAVSGDEVKSSAVLHLTHSVLWTDEEAVLASLIKEDGGEWQLLEVGPGKVLSGLWGQTSFGAELACSPVNTADALAAL